MNAETKQTSNVETKQADQELAKVLKVKTRIKAGPRVY
jgi:hypothetical protein